MLWFFFSCMTNYVKVDQAYDIQQRTPVLLSGAALRADSFFPSTGEHNSVEDLILFHMQQFVNQKLPLVGEDMVDQILPHLTRWGAVTYTDPERTYVLNHKKSQVSSVNTQLLGIWIDPNASGKFITGQDLFLFRRSQKVVSLLKENLSTSEFLNEREGYLFIHAAYYSSTFFLMRYPIAILDILVIGNDGQIWLQARTIGEGDKRMFDLDISEENLRLALQNAIDTLGVLEIITIQRRGKFKKLSYPKEF
jgi:hypothetical protein